MKFAPFKPCTLPKHVRVEILHREFPVKNLYFPCKGLQCVCIYLYAIDDSHVIVDDSIAFLNLIGFCHFD